MGDTPFNGRPHATSASTQTGLPGRRVEIYLFSQSSEQIKIAEGGNRDILDRMGETGLFK
jgi:hypothetical protein